MATAIRKNGEVYFNYSTLLNECNYLFGVTPQMRRDVVEKLEKQKQYLKNTFLCVDGVLTNFSLMDMSLTANMQPSRYHGEIWSRVNALQNYAQMIGYTTPVFMTITPKTEFKPTKQIQLGKKKDMYKLIDNPKFMGFHNGSVDYVKQSLEYISQKWRKFTRQRLFNDIRKKYGERVIFMRTYEPHIDGTPHAHLVAFIPPEFKERFVNLANGYFTESRFDIKTEFDAQKGGVVSYILKYILKSFENAKEGKLDPVACWYAYHQIRRFTTSRTLVPLSLFRKINKHESMQNMLNTTLKFKEGHFELGMSYHPYLPLYKDMSEFENKDYKVATISVFLPNDEESCFQILYEKKYNIDFYTSDKLDKDDFAPFKGVIKQKKPINVHIKGDFRRFLLKDGELIEVVRSLNNFSKFDLYLYFMKLDIEKCNFQHYHLVRNRLIDKGMIYGTPQNLNFCNTNFNEVERLHNLGA